LPLVFGPAGPAVRAQAARGEIVLGGLNHGRNEPRWQCARCHTRFGRAREDRDRFGRPNAVAAAGARVIPAWRLLKTARLPAMAEAAVAA